MRKVFSFIWLAGIFLASCQSEPTQPALETVVVPQRTATSMLPPTVEASPTPMQPVLLLVIPPGTGSELSSDLEVVFEEQAAAAGLDLVKVESLSLADLGEEVRGVILFSTDSAVPTISQAPSGVKFLILGDLDQPQGEGVLVVDGRAVNLDQSGFLAGYLSAVLTTDWRVGLVLPGQSTPEEKSVETAFRNGVIFYCGLCRPAYPPYVAYPAVINLPPGAGEAEFQAVIDELRNIGVVTVYVPPMVVEPSFFQALASVGINIIGSGAPPSGVEPNWIASIEPDLVEAVKTLGVEWLTSDLPILNEVPIHITRVNPELFSTGRQNLVAKLQEDLQAGYIDTGVDPLTGEQKP